MRESDWSSDVCSSDLKQELTDFCKALKIPTHGKKLEILDRIETFLTTGALAKAHTQKPLNKTKTRIYCCIQPEKTSPPKIQSHPPSVHLSNI